MLVIVFQASYERDEYHQIENEKVVVQFYYEKRRRCSSYNAGASREGRLGSDSNRCEVSIPCSGLVKGSGQDKTTLGAKVDVVARVWTVDSEVDI